jgi:hypothetical protein
VKSLLLTTAVLLASISHAATSVDLPLSGTVTAIYDLQIAVKGEAANLNIVAGENDLSVATVSEQSNALNGYKIMARSTNASKLQNTTDPTKSTSYTINYDGAGPITLSSSDALVKTVSSLPGLTTVDSDVQVTVAPYGTAPAGTYTDTVTFTILAN